MNIINFDNDTFFLILFICYLAAYLMIKFNTSSNNGDGFLSIILKAYHGLGLYIIKFFNVYQK